MSTTTADRTVLTDESDMEFVNLSLGPSNGIVTQSLSTVSSNVVQMDASTAIITQPALGQDVQLGMLYDVRTAQFFSGVSLWNNEVVNAKQELDEQSVQNAEFTYAFSL